MSGSKFAVINFSGNVGKSTVSKHLLMPRVKNAEYVAVESINSGEDDGEAVRGKQFGALQEQLMLIDAAVVDVGASNVEDFVKLMQQYRGSHEEFDRFLVPVVKEGKQIKDSIATIEALAAMGVDRKRIVVVFNKLESDETVEDAFYPIIAYHKDMNKFTLKPEAVIHYSELYQRLRQSGASIPDVLGDETDYKTKLRETTDPEQRAEFANRISMRRLAFAANENLDAVFKAVTSK